MINHRGIILDGYTHLSPSCRISPFKSEYMLGNRHRDQGSSSGDISKYFNKLFPEKSIQLTSDGRSAIGRALEILGLKGDDCVTIITTTNNLYISGCVTKEIEKRCSWSRDINSNTKAIFINHEFGLLCRNVEAYRKLGIPIIQDFAHSFCSLSEAAASGIQGDFLVCSFSKIFPMQAGGALLLDRKHAPLYEGDSEILRYVDSNASFYINSLEQVKKKRLRNHEVFVKKFRSIGIDSFFDFSEGDVPSVFCFKLQENINAPNFKDYMNTNGIESSIFYGQNAYFVPCHQNMSQADIDYVYEVVSYYMGG